MTWAPASGERRTSAGSSARVPPAVSGDGGVIIGAPPARLAAEARVSSQPIVQATVVIPTLDARDLLARTLESLARQTAPSRVVVVANASGGGTAEMVAERVPAVTLLSA